MVVAAGGTADVSLQLTSYATDASGSSYPFTVTATAYSSTGTGAVGTAAGTLSVAGAALPASNPTAYGAVATLTPSSATAGQETTADYVVQVTNTGSAEEEFYPQISGLPGGSYGSFGVYGVDVPPGAVNFRDIPLAVTVGDTPQGTYPFTVTVSAYNSGSSFSATVQGTLIVESSGVVVYLSPYGGVAPGGTVDATIYNYGSATDSFNLALSGPGAAVATLGQSSVMNLEPDGEQQVQITIGQASFAAAGVLPLFVTATSQTDSAVMSSASTTINVAHHPRACRYRQSPVRRAASARPHVVRA